MRISSRKGIRTIGVLTVGITLLRAAAADAQVTPAAASKPPDDTPRIRVGTTIFADYTLQQAPDIRDAAGNDVNFSAFQVPRAYINITGQVHHLLSFRVTPDVQRESGTGSSLSGSMTFRLKYAYAQLNLDDWMPRGSWVRFGMQQTPLIDYQESVYRYRFQGPVFVDREGFLSSADTGLSFRTSFPNNYGDVHAGIYNGETYSRAEANDQKAFMIRATVRPFPTARTLRGLRITGFYDADAPVEGGERRRVVADVSFEQKWVSAGSIFLASADQNLPTAGQRDGRGISVWATPRTTNGWEAVLRYDRLEPHKDDEEVKTRALAGIAYWLPLTGAQAAFLLDFENVDYRHFVPARPKEQRLALHMLINF
jgi:hypothetical protein